MKYIPKNKLKLGWYKGIGRNSNIALWTGKTFLTMSIKFNEFVVKDEGLYEKGWCFMPLQFLDDWNCGNLNNILNRIKKQQKLKEKYNYK